MQIPILIEPVAGNGFRSRGGEPFALSAERRMAPEEVSAKLQEQLRLRLCDGVEVVNLDVGERSAAILGSNSQACSRMTPTSTSGSKRLPRIGARSTRIRKFHESFRPGFKPLPGRE